MPDYLKQDGKPVADVVIKQGWIIIPVESPSQEETYLVPLRVKEYILLLENAMGDNLLKLQP